MKNNMLEEKNNKIKLELIQICIVIIMATISVIMYYSINNIIAAIMLGLLGIEILAINKKTFGYITNMPGIFGGVWFITIALACVMLHHRQVTWKFDTWICLIFAYITFLIGYVAFNIKLTNKIEKKNKITNQITKKKYLKFLYGITLLSTIALIIEIIIRKEIPAFSQDMASYQRFSVTGVHYFTVLSCFILPITIVGIATYRKEISKIEYIWIIISNIIGICIPILIVSRHLILMTLVLSAFTLITIYAKIEKIVIIAIALVGILGWFGISSLRKQDDAYLKAALEIQDESILTIKNMQIYMYVACNYDNFNANVGAINKYTYGTKSLFPIFALTGVKFIVPEIEEENLNRFVGVYNTYPIIIESYQDFGQIGVIIYMTIIGYICAYVENMNKKQPTNILIDSIVKYCLMFSFFTNGFATPAIWFYVIVFTISKKLYFKDEILKIENKKENKRKIGMNKKIAILMATYNGEKYISEQIDSILSQTYSNFVLYIRDDNSKDATTNILEAYAKKYPEKIKVVKDNRIAKGACNNFMFLLEYVYGLKEYEIFMFSDQDDVWIKTKIEQTLEAYEEQENKKIPILIHTDLQVVDEKLQILNESFMNYSKLNKKNNKLNNYLVQNNVTGCTMLINKELVNKIDFKIKEIRMHDWYFALLASAFGKIIYIDKATINYRQHGNNVIGAKKANVVGQISKGINRKEEIKKSINELYKQARTFYNVHGSQMDLYNKKIVEEFINMQEKNKIKRIITIIKYRFYKQSFFRVIGEFIYL